MSELEEFYNLVYSGKRGENVGISSGLNKLDEYTEGYSQGTSFLIAGSSGTGKTSYALYSFIYKPIMSKDCEARDLQYLICNYEMTTSQMLAKLLSIYLFETYHIVITFKDIFSRGKDAEGNPNIISDENLELVEKAKPILTKFLNRIKFIPHARTYEQFEAECFSFLNKFGTFKDPFGRFDKNTYTPNNPNQIIGIMIDHMSLLKASGSITKKKVIDDVSNCCVRIRNMCQIVSPILLMQLNRGGMDGNRVRADMMEPVAEDLKDSGTVFEDSHVVFALYCPAKNNLAQHRHYDITRLGNRYISLKVLKNRFGESNIADPLAYYGEITTFVELPKHSEINDYEKYTTPDWLTEDIEDEIITPIKSFKL